MCVFKSRFLKDKLQAIVDLRNTISAKTKSLKRRKGSGSTVEKLDEIYTSISDKYDFLKKVQTGSHHDNLYEDAVQLSSSGMDIPPAVWERIMKVIAFEDRGEGIFWFGLG